MAKRNRKNSPLIIYAIIGIVLLLQLFCVFSNSWTVSSDGTSVGLWNYCDSNSNCAKTDTRFSGTFLNLVRVSVLLGVLLTVLCVVFFYLKRPLFAMSLLTVSGLLFLVAMVVWQKNVGLPNQKTGSAMIMAFLIGLFNTVSFLIFSSFGKM